MRLPPDRLTFPSNSGSAWLRPGFSDSGTRFYIDTCHIAVTELSLLQRLPRKFSGLREVTLCTQLVLRATFLPSDVKRFFYFFSPAAIFRSGFFEKPLPSKLYRKRT